MEIETMFMDQKWNILKCLSENKYSPLQLSEKLDTTMANISQQLRMLEAMNLVKKEKIRNRDKGKPRTLFSLQEDRAYLISAMGSFAQKKLMRVNDHHKTILKIWFIEDEELQYTVEKLYWKLRKSLKDINYIGVDEKEKEIFIKVEDNKVKNKLKFKSDIRINVIGPHEKSFSKNQDGITVIYKKEDILRESS